MNIKHGFLLACVLFAIASWTAIDTNPEASLANNIDFGTSWNNHCGSFNFDGNLAAISTTTLGEMYLGNDFPADIAGMDIAITEDLGAASGLAGAGSTDLYGFFDPFGDPDDED